jgi:hypothetical protein
MFLYRLLVVRDDAAVLMTDTDVCYHADVVKALAEGAYPVVVNGNTDSLTIGMLFGRRTEGAPTHADAALVFYGDLERRLRFLRLDGAAAGRYSDRVVCRNKDVRLLGVPGWAGR